MTFTDKEIVYLEGQLLGRLATIGADGAPHNVPVGFRFNGELGTIDIGGITLPQTRKFHDVQGESRVSFVVDDLESTDPWVPRGIEIRGTAEALATGGQSFGARYAPELIRITPRRIIAWGIDTPPFSAPNARNVPGPGAA
jgi:pyridoxamine 5'-phosphate oxidase family protein